MRTKVNIVHFLTNDQIEAIVYAFIMLEPIHSNRLKKITKGRIQQMIQSELRNSGVGNFDDLTWAYDNCEDYELRTHIEDSVSKHFKSKI